MKRAKSHGHVQWRSKKSIKVRFRLVAYTCGREGSCWKDSFKVDPFAQGFKGASKQKLNNVGIKTRGQLTVNCQNDQ
jgi:hypothetical protein